jgi:DNA-binding transcriptional MerR regulator
MINEPSKDQQALYPIREVSRLTGIKPITLRAWERRYGLVEPVRTASGHRLYTENHLAIIKEAITLVDSGLPISQVKTILNERSELLTPKAPIECLDCDWDNVIRQAIKAKSFQQLHALTLRLLTTERKYSDLAHLFLQLSNTQISNDMDCNERFWIKAWLQELNQQLSHRIHLWRQQTYQSKNLILILQQAETPGWLLKLMALHCYEQGLTPVFTEQVFESIHDLVLPQDLTPFKGAIYLLPPQVSATMMDVGDLLKPLGSLQSWIMGDNTFEEGNHSAVACDLRAWPFWFEPLLMNKAQ